MNNKIEELRQQAMETYFTELNVEKFAQLIIKECIDNINNHFGIEK